MPPSCVATHDAATKICRSKAMCSKVARLGKIYESKVETRVEETDVMSKASTVMMPNRTVQRHWST